MFEVPLEIKMLMDYLDTMDMVEEDKKIAQQQKDKEKE